MPHRSIPKEAVSTSVIIAISQIISLHPLKHLCLKSTRFQIRYLSNKIIAMFVRIQSVEWKKTTVFPSANDPVLLFFSAFKTVTPTERFHSLNLDKDRPSMQENNIVCKKNELTAQKSGRTRGTWWSSCGPIPRRTLPLDPCRNASARFPLSTPTPIFLTSTFWNKNR